MKTNQQIALIEDKVVYLTKNALHILIHKNHMIFFYDIDEKCLVRDDDKKNMKFKEFRLKKLN